jgi:cyclopropane fatty-acyl-phospholipid synthase-like methyltransferase
MKSFSNNLLPHLGGYMNEGDPYTWMPDIWGYLLIKYNLNSVVDIGCGLGHNLSWFKNMNLEICGIEGMEDAIKKSVIPNDVILHDFTKGQLKLQKKYDLAISTEFVEHVESIYEKNWMSVLDSCEYFLMSHALPRQKGHHHVNCQESNYWIEKITSIGFKYDHELSTIFKNTNNRMHSKWGRNTLLFFKKNT